MALPKSLGELSAWTTYRLRVRMPKLMARLQRELPLIPIADLYTSVPDKGWRIPSTVYQAWIEDRLGRSHSASLARFRERNADFSFVLFDHAMIDSYMAERWGDHPIYDVYRHAMYGPIRIDIWRYCILHERGGIYLDISKSIETPLRDLVTPGCDAVISWEGKVPPSAPSDEARAVLLCPDDVMINSALMFAPGHPLLRRAIDGIVANYPHVAGKVCVHPKEAILNFSGPHFLTQCLFACAEAGELDDARQMPVNFGGAFEWYMPGSWVRHATVPPYELARNCMIVS